MENRKLLTWSAVVLVTLGIVVGVYFFLITKQKGQLAAESSSTESQSQTTSGEDDTQITSPVELSEDIENNCVGFLSGNVNETELIAEVGAAWTRPHPGPFAWEWIESEEGTYDFTSADAWVKTAGDNGVAVLPTIWPFAEWDQQTCREIEECTVSDTDQFVPADEEKTDEKSKDGIEFEGGVSGIPATRCAPCDYSAYKAFLTALVERYDGDGTDDMPGLTIPIKYWEVSNEPSMRGGDLTFFLGTQEEYVEVLKNSYEAIKGACSDCLVLHAGAAGARDEDLEYWGKIIDLDAGVYFNISNVHCIGCDANDLNVESFSGMLEEKGLEKPIWVTEAEFRSEEDIIPVFQNALDSGASKVFFVSLGGIGHAAPEKDSVNEIFEDISEYCD